MATSAAELRKQIEGLREPTRSVALEQVRRLLDDGRSELEALEAALRTADEWERTRAPSTAGRQGTSNP